jgi:hypothetical protein
MIYMQSEVKILDKLEWNPPSSLGEQDTDHHSDDATDNITSKDDRIFIYTADNRLGQVFLGNKHPPSPVIALFA